LQNIFDSVNDRRNAEKVKFICYDRPNPTWDGSSAVVWHKGGWGVCCKFLMQLRIDLSVLSGVLSCLRCGPALLVRASVSEPVMRASARHGVWTIIQGGGWWRRTTPSGFSTGVRPSEARTQRGRERRTL